MKHALWLVLLTLAAFLIDMNLSISGFRTDLVTLVVYRYALTSTPARGMLFGSVLGAAEDALSGMMIGPALLGKGLVGFASPFLSRGFFRWTPVLGFLGPFALTIVGGLAEYASLSIFEDIKGGFVPGIALLIAQGALNGFIGILLRPEKDEF